MKLDALAFGVHPDDAELGCAGTLLKLHETGKETGIVDITRGELGTRGTPEIRDEEGENAKLILGASIRENLNLPDGFFRNDKASQLRAIKIIRKYQPDIIFCNAIYDRHPDHGRSAQLVEDAAFLSGLLKVRTALHGKPQNPWRPQIVFHYIQDRYIKPDIVVDISNYWDKKMESILAHKTQFYNPESKEPATYIASKEFLENIRSRAMELGRPCGFLYAEGFTCARSLGIDDISTLR